jgi:hypothetical protein
MEKLPQNNEPSPAERRWRPEADETVRQMIYHEGELINHRIGWLVTLQGLLFAALGFAWNDAKELVYVIICPWNSHISLNIFRFYFGSLCF